MSLSYENCLGLFKKAILNQRIASAYLISGVSSSLLLNLGMEISRELLGSDPSKHPDFYLLKPQTKLKRISVQQIKDVCRDLYLRPYRESRKVCLILQAESMCFGGGEAANAFLKTLEEPPLNTTIILTSTRPMALFPTLLSRCLCLSVSGFPFEISPEDQDIWPEVQKWLEIEEEEEIGRLKKIAFLNDFIQKAKIAIESEKKEEDQQEKESQEGVALEILEKRERFLRLVELACWHKIQAEMEKGASAQSCLKLIEEIRRVERLNQDLNYGMEESLAIEAAFLPRNITRN
ncbi:DNA replication protein [Methylacidiphilum caldifontis]|uniref:DNA replication protein n=1 Tax=Methylacidiphilum caldifontis TaxID=2795386 RepID=A0A4Y8PHF0_9BACT|nr:DNA replication protein [Methylacidiphilum caldifontis]TFE72085.1 DNA replication protein [Methylacidiphilum caldifontis]